MTTKELYIKHKSGDISNQKFLYEVRRDSKLPWITNMTSYEDAVKILKNKGIINEADGKKYGDVEIIAKTIDMVNPYEYSKGMNYELDMADNAVRTDLTEDEVLAAQKKVLANITKDANYYTKLYAGLKPTADTGNYIEIEIAGKSLEKNLKAEMQGRKADGYIKKELKKDPKANVKDDLGKKEAGTKKPKGVSEFKDKGVTGSVKVVKESIEEIIREKLAQKKSNEAKVEESNIDIHQAAKDIINDILEFYDLHAMTFDDAKKIVANYSYQGQEAIDIAKEMMKYSQQNEVKAKVEEAVGNFELKKLARELYSVIKKVNGVTGVKIVTSDIKNAASAFQAVSKKGNTYADDAVMAEIFVNEANSFISIILSGTSRVLNPVANEVNKQLQAFVGKNYADQLDAQYVKAPNDNTMLGINIKFKNNPSGVKEAKQEESAVGKMKEALKKALKSDDKVKAIKEKKDKSLEEGVLDDQIAQAEKAVAQKKKETADAEKKLADIKAKEAAAEAQG